MTEPETTPRRGRRARALSPEELAALEARAPREASGAATGMPGVRGAVAPPGADEPVPMLRKFGRRARIIELSEDGASDAPAGADAPTAPAEETSIATIARDHDGVELGELSVTDAPDPRPAPRFEGKVLHRPERSGGRALVLLVWALIAIALIALVVLLLTGVLGPAATAGALPITPEHLLDHPLLEKITA